MAREGVTPEQLRGALREALREADYVRWDHHRRRWRCRHCGSTAAGPGEVVHHWDCPVAIYRRAVNDGVCVEER